MNEARLNDRPRSLIGRSAPATRWAKRGGALALVVAALGCAEAPPPEAVAPGPATAADGAMTVIDTPKAEAATYEIRMHRPASAGRRGQVISVGEEHMKMQLRSNGQMVREQRQDSRVLLMAVESVISIDDRGRPVESEYTVKRFEKDRPGGAEVLLPPGQVVTVIRGTRGVEGQAMVAGQAVSAAVLSALSSVVTMSAVSDATDDDAFGTTTRRSPGAQWPMHADAAARDLAETTGIKATLSGATRLLRRATFQETDCLELATEMNGKLLAFDKLPPGARLRTGTFEVVFRGMQPIDVAMPKLSTSMRMTMHVIADFDSNGQPTELDTTVTKQMDDSFTPL